MENSNTCKTRDVVINFKDLCLSVLLHWRSIIVCMLIFGILLCGFKYVKDLSSSPSSAKKVNIEEMYEKLTPEQRADASAVVSLKKMMAKQSNFLNESPLFKISAGRADVTVLNYAVSGKDAVIKANAFSLLLKDNALFEKIKADLGSDLPGEYFSDLIFFDVVTPENESADASALLKISVYAATGEEAEKMAKTVGEFVETAKGKNTDKSYTVTKVSESTSIGVSDSIRNNQQNAVNLYNTFRNAVKDSLTQLDDDETAYYEAAIAAENETELDAEETETEKDENYKPSISKKYALLGLALGAALAVCFYILKYLFTRKVKSADDIKCRYNLFVLGQSESVAAKKKNAIDKFIIRILSGKPDKNETENAVKNALLAAKNAFADDVLLVVEKEEENNQTVKSIADILKENGIKSEIIAPPSIDAKSTEKFADSLFTILFKTAGVSSYDGIYRELDLSERYDTPILGVVVLK